MKEIENLIRPELLGLKPYSSARSEFKGKAKIYIDANENPYESDINRYPDPLQLKLKEKIANVKGIPVDQIFLGNGSDEVLDLIIRLFCIPGRDEIIITPPTYGMYKVLAGINNVNIREINLDDNFQVKVDHILKFYNRKTKILFLCTPNNPVGNTLNESDIKRLLDTFPGLIVIDEAYIDFSSQTTYARFIDEYPRLLITQTLSKAWGMAGIRLGIGICNPYIVNKLNGIKPPYNVNTLTQKKALENLEHIDDFNSKVDSLVAERNKLESELEKLEIVEHVHDSEANFLLVRFDDAMAYFHELRELGIIVRNRTKEINCENCLRITIGSPNENRKLIDALKTLDKK